MTSVLRQITASGYDPRLLPPFAREEGYPQAWRKAIGAAFTAGWRGSYAQVKRRLDLALALDAARPGLSARILGLYDPGFCLLDGAGKATIAFNASGIFPALPSTSATTIAAAVGTTPAYWDFVPGGAFRSLIDIALVQAIPGIAIVSVYSHVTRGSARGYPALLRRLTSSGTQFVQLGGGAYLSSVSDRWTVESRAALAAADTPAQGYGVATSVTGVPKLQIVRADVLNNRRSMTINGVEVVADTPFTPETGRPGAFYGTDGVAFGIGDAITGTSQIHVWESWVVRLSGNKASDDADIAAVSAIINARNPQIA